MSESVTIIPDEFHDVTTRAQTLADVDGYMRSAHEVAFTVNKHIRTPDELEIKCCFWSEETHWIVKATLFGSDAQCVAFITLWARR